MQIDRQDRETAVVLRVHESRIDAAAAIRFKDRVRELTADQPARVVLDLRDVQFLDSSGLGAVVAAMKLLGPGSRLELAALTPAVERVFRLTRMDTVFAIHADADMAASGLPRAS
ncbi:MAG: STAS domain-containing protein [Rhodobacteraceae bacterium]|jgi:anti-sigma B factor antagonist|nr:STAS domain-containing protein [Paracoccaceae bacterium]